MVAAPVTLTTVGSGTRSIRQLRAQLRVVSARLDAVTGTVAVTGTGTVTLSSPVPARTLVAPPAGPPVDGLPAPR